MATIPLTRRGAEKLKEELRRLKTVERHAVIQAISEARAQGDLSENAEYEAAKDKQGFIEGRILEIESKLAAAQIIDPATLDAEGRVVFGSTVDLEEEDSGAKVTYQIVGDDEADLKLGLISISSPIARALIGKVAGDVAEVQAPGGVKSYEIIGRALRVSDALRPRRLRQLAAWLAGAVGRADRRRRRWSPRRRLFATLARADAGRVAGRLFAIEAYLGLALGALLLVARACALARDAGRRRLALQRRDAAGAGCAVLHRRRATSRCSR